MMVDSSRSSPSFSDRPPRRKFSARPASALLGRPTRLTGNAQTGSSLRPPVTAVILTILRTVAAGSDNMQAGAAQPSNIGPTATFLAGRRFETNCRRCWRCRGSGRPGGLRCHARWCRERIPVRADSIQRAIAVHLVVHFQVRHRAAAAAPMPRASSTPKPHPLLLKFECDSKGDLGREPERAQLLRGQLRDFRELQRGWDRD